MDKKKDEDRSKYIVDVGDYQFMKGDLIGSGAFAVVYKGYHKERKDFTVAIKAITKKSLAKSSNLLSKEIKILKELSNLHHENVVHLYDCKETAGEVYLVMEYCNGGDLADYLQAQGVLTEETIAIFLKQIAAAFKALNEHHIVHRDMKPQNILLTYEGEKKKRFPPAEQIKLKIADFGFARFLHEGTLAITLCGSPMYMAPEVIMGVQYDAKADLWSIGTIVYQCLTGKAPFQAQTPNQLKDYYAKNVHLIPKIPPSTSPELKNLLTSMLRKNTKDRLEFEDFFNHPFLYPKSSPVPMPGGRSHSRSSLSESPKVTSASPLSQMSPPNPPYIPRYSPRRQEPMDTVERGQPRPPPRRPSGGRAPLVTADDTEGFVLVPEDIPHDLQPPGLADLQAVFSDPPDSPRHPPKAVRAAPYARKSPGVGSPPHRSPPQSTGQSPRQQLADSPTGGGSRRPSTLPVVSSPSPPAVTSPPTVASPPSRPVPVPSQVEAYEEIQRSLQGHSAMSTGAESPRSPQQLLPAAGKGMPIPSSPRRYGSNSDIGSMSPPNVQWVIGSSSPQTTWTRRHSLTNPTVATGSSPQRKQFGSLPKTMTVPCSLSSGLPTIMDSPAKGVSFAANPFSPVEETPGAAAATSRPISTPFAGARTRSKTCPDYITAVGYSPEEASKCIVPVERDYEMQTSSRSSSRLSDQLLKAAFSGQLPSPPNAGAQHFPLLLGQTPPQPSNMVVRFGGSSTSLNRTGSTSSLNTGAMSRQRTVSTGDEATSPYSPGATLYGHSPSNLDGAMNFVAPDLEEETLMDKEHNDTVSKLNFILALVECIIEAAQTRSSPITHSMTVTEKGFKLDHGGAFLTEQQRRLEQLVLYVRALQLLTSSIQLAKEEVHAHRLQPTNTVKMILKDMNNYYHQCLVVCKNLHSKGPGTTDDSFDTHAATITADKLIYTYAIDMCQTAALDELFGNPQDCFHRYRNAQIMLHSLAQATQSEEDRALLNKYREAVEKRLTILQGQIHNAATMTN